MKRETAFELPLLESNYENWNISLVYFCLRNNWIPFQEFSLNINSIYIIIYGCLCKIFSVWKRFFFIVPFLFSHEHKGFSRIFILSYFKWQWAYEVWIFFASYGLWTYFFLTKCIVEISIFPLYLQYAFLFSWIHLLQRKLYLFTIYKPYGRNMATLWGNVSLQNMFIFVPLNVVGIFILISNKNC